MPTWSSNSWGAAPVPPSAPSTMMKSGVIPDCSIALQIDRNSVRAPIQSLNPTGFPPERLRSVATKSISSRGVLNAVCAGGDTTVWPTGTPRVSAISGVTLGPGSTPPRPGLAPWESLIEMALTDGSAAFSVNFSASKCPSGVRHPK